MPTALWDASADRWVNDDVTDVLPAGVLPHATSRPRWGDSSTRVVTSPVIALLHSVVVADVDINGERRGPTSPCVLV